MSSFMGLTPGNPGLWQNSPGGTDFDFDHIVFKGKVDRRTYKKLKNNNEHVGIDFPVMTFWEHFKLNLMKIRAQIVRTVIPGPIKSAFRKIKYNN